MNKTYIFDTEHYLAWCQANSLNKNCYEVLDLFKSRCEFEAKYQEVRKATGKDMPNYDSI